MVLTGRFTGGFARSWRDMYNRTLATRFSKEQARQLRAERVRQVASNRTVIAICNIIYATLGTLYFWGLGADLALASWLVVVVAVNGWVVVQQLRRDPSRVPTGSRRSTNSIIASTVMMAVIFSVVPFFLIPVTTGTEALILGGMSTATLVIGPYIVYAVPRAALAWLIVCTGLNSLSYGLAGGVFTVAALFGILIAVAVAHACLTQAAQMTDQFAARLELERHAKALAEKQDVIALLLKEYEEGSGAWLWECDAKGELTRVPAQLLALLPVSAATDRSLFTLASSVPESERVRTLTELSQLLTAEKPFHDFLIPLIDREGVGRWLSARGRPRFDDVGTFVGFRGIVTDVTEAKLAEDRVRFLASHDALTELPNRITYAGHVRPWSQCGRRFASLHVDLDRFKLVNDTLGHMAGDELLVQVAHRLRTACAGAHPDALPARVGGDEFMACIPLDQDSADDTPARNLADAIVRALTEPFELEAGTCSIGGSVGYAVWPDDGDLSEIPARVDLALYRAKESGRGQFQRYENGMDRRAQDRKKLEAELRGALARDEMHLAFQPIMDLENGRPAGLEALLRWTHPELGVVPPDSFIPLAEDSGLIVEIGSWVLREACREAAGWSKPLTIAVNVSARQMLREDFVQTVLSALAASGLAPERLELELTESILVEDPDTALAAIDKLRRIGCRVVLDDFGTGYSSLSYLRTFVFDKIKVDRSFVATLREKRSDGRPCSSTLVEAIIGMARTLGMRTTAEGIEEDWQAEDLRGIGCDQGQGYFYSRPVPSDGVAAVAGTAPIPRAAKKPGRREVA